MPGLTKRRRLWRWIGMACGLLFVLAVVAVLAATVFAPASTGGGTASARQHCAPAPCASPRGFTVWISRVNGIAPGAPSPAHGRRYVTMRATFKSAFAATIFDATNSVRADPRDFMLRDARGREYAVTFSARPGCARWRVTTLAEGATLGPKPLCFALPRAAHAPFSLIWSPDLGVLFSGTAIPLR